MSSKLIKFGHPISLGNMTLCCKEMYPLLLECFKTALGCVTMIGSAPGSTSGPFMGQHSVLSTKGNSQFPSTMTDFWTPYQPWKCGFVW